MSEYRYYLCDVFTDRAFGGNPLAVLTDARGLDDPVMQAVAREFNFSETVFVTPPEDPRHTARMRIFTPGGELPFAGHPTIGTAFVLGSIGAAPGASELGLEQGIGPVKVTIDRDRGRIVRCTLTAPRAPERSAPTPAPRALAAMLSLEPSELAAPAEGWSCGVPFLVVPLVSTDALQRARLNLEKWTKLLSASATSKVYPVAHVDESTWRVRMFAPSLGVTEDAATGSAAAAFAGWLARRAQPGTATLRWTILQGSEIGRPSTIHLEADVVDDHAVAVRVGGSAVMIADGTLRL
jgi:trans-2,3-dihydro-3-hydroxyanthranilate isomerase